MQSTAAASSQKLIQCLTKLDIGGEGHASAKMDLLLIVSELMPKGIPNYLAVVRHPQISDLVLLHGKKTMLGILTLMVKDFCGSINVVRNMNEDQMIETAAMLLDECGNFRLEDYVMMFNLAKKGELFKIFDHLDIQVVTQIFDAYWHRRHTAGRAEVESDEKRLKEIGNTTRSIELLHPEDKKLVERGNNLEGAIEQMKDLLDRNF